jgi:predicted kinase
MEAIFFIGLQAAGKSSFYKEHFFRTHLRINLDMLKTRHREDVILKACLEAKQSFVIDNTNPTIDERRKYIEAAKASHFAVIGYYFKSSLSEALQRNSSRSERVPDKAIFATHKKLQIPVLAEGFDKLFYVSINETGEFVIQDWADEV